MLKVVDSMAARVGDGLKSISSPDRDTSIFFIYTGIERRWWKKYRKSIEKSIPHMAGNWIIVFSVDLLCYALFVDDVVRLLRYVGVKVLLMTKSNGLNVVLPLVSRYIISELVRDETVDFNFSLKFSLL